jgi:spore germination cell wall hydrolase CwlJ-like protein
MSDTTKLAMAIYGEAANQKPDVMRKIGSTVLNRLASGKTKEFGGSLDEVLYKGYYAVKNNSPMYQEAMSGKFKDEVSETAYKQALAIASGLIKGTITPDKGEFYFTKSEINKLKKKGKKAFNFDAVKKFEEFGDYQMFGY